MFVFFTFLKYGLKKKTIEKEEPEPDDAGRISRKKKTPAEMQAAMEHLVVEKKKRNKVC